MSKMKVLAAGSALGVAMLAGPALAAVTGTVNITSEYVFRGIDSSSGAAVQGSLDWSEGGWNLGTWASNTFGSTASECEGTGTAVALGTPFIVASECEGLPTGGTELDLYSGYTFDLGGGSSIDIGAIYYIFPESEQIPDFKFDADYWEVYAGFAAGGFAAKVYYADEFFNDLSDDGLGSVKGEESIYVNLSFTAPIKEGLDFAIAVGQQSGDGAENLFGDDVVDYSFSLSKALENGFSATFAVVGTDLEVKDATGVTLFDDDPKVVVSLAKGFDI